MRTCSHLEGGAGVAGSRRKVKGDDEVDAALRPQDERVGEVVGQAAVHHMDLFAFHIQRLVDAHKLVRVCKHECAGLWAGSSTRGSILAYTRWHSKSFLSCESLVSYCRIRFGYKLKNAFNHTFDYHLSYDRKTLIALKTAETNLLTKDRDPRLEYGTSDLLRSTHRQLNSLGFPPATSGYLTTPVLL